MKTLIVLSLLVLGLGTADAEVRVHHVFDNNMVLQRDKPARIWGWADAGERVRVEFAAQTKTAAADKDGKWIVELEPVAANAEPQALVVKGQANSVRFENVLVGDVWVLGGQSNMEDVLENEFGIRCTGKRLRLPSAVSDAAQALDFVLQAVGLYEQRVHVLGEMNKTIACAIDKAKADLGYAPRTSLREGMVESVRWCLENGEHL